MCLFVSCGKRDSRALYLICNELVWRGEDNKIHKKRRVTARYACISYATQPTGPGRVVGSGKYRGTPLLARHLYAARLTLHKKLNCKSCSSRDSLGKDVLGLLIFDPVRILRPRTRSALLFLYLTLPLPYRKTMHGHPSTHRRSGSQHRATPTSKSRKMQR